MVFPSNSQVGAAMPTRNLELTKDQENIIETLIGSGRYQNASEILDEGLRLVQQREAEDAAKVEALREAAGVGFGALDRGELRDLESIDDLQAHVNGVSEAVISGGSE
jgi:antitoxin ParD1/3/4